MSMRFTLASLSAAMIAALTTFLAMCAVAKRAGAEEQAAPPPPACSCPDGKTARPKLAELRTDLDDDDAIAALQTVQYALSEVADGASYVWHRGHGRLSGLVQPTSSFKDASGGVCRHVIVVLNTAEKSERTEAVACRLSNGIWKLDG